MRRALGISLGAALAISAFVILTGRAQEPAPSRPAPVAQEPAAPQVQSPIAATTPSATNSDPPPRLVASAVPVLAPLPVAPKATAPTALAEPEENVFAAPTVFPASLDEVPSTPWREAQLAKYTPQERGMLDFKLGLMSRMRQCASSVTAEGPVTVFLHYSFDPGTHLATGTEVELIKPTTKEAEAAAECIRTALVGSTMPMTEEPANGEFHWATEFGFPLEKDRAYQFFAR